MSAQMKKILQDYIEQVQQIYGCHLASIILYGSYARGDAHPDSDIDIMILVDLSDEKIREFGEQLSQVTFDTNLDNDVMIMPIVKNISHFRKWIPSYPFYRNINQEGVRLYGAA